MQSKSKFLASKWIWSCAFCMRSCSQIFLSTMVSTMERWFTIFESDAIVYICTYYHSTNRTQNIYYRHCSELLLPRCINLLIGGAKHSLIPVVCVLSDIYYCNLALWSPLWCDGLPYLNLTQLFIFVLIIIALIGLKIFITDIAANYCCRAA